MKVAEDSQTLGSEFKMCSSSHASVHAPSLLARHQSKLGKRRASWEIAHQHKQSQSTLAQAHPENNNAKTGKVFTDTVLGSTGCMILTYPPTCFLHYSATAFIRALSSFSSSSSSEPLELSSVVGG